jgi:glycerol-3-phosphate O-acyltransferase/dihydroxyacetone phosphate acyltransferase
VNQESAKFLKNTKTSKFCVCANDFSRQRHVFSPIIHAFISIALRLFFRRIEAVNVEKVPKTGAVIFVLNHPNGLVDPALVFVSSAPRFVSRQIHAFDSRRRFLAAVASNLPVYRRVDAAGDMSKNQQTFEIATSCSIAVAASPFFPKAFRTTKPNSSR